MIFRNLKVIVFYGNIKLFNFFIDLCIFSIGYDFIINNICLKDEVYFFE